MNSPTTEQGGHDTWVIGDVHGCHSTLKKLLDSLLEIDLDSRFVFVGDLVGKGPASLEVLKTVDSLGDRAQVILGNHDLHLLAVHAQVAKSRPGDLLEPCLEEAEPSPPSSWCWVRWLEQKPLALLQSDSTGTPWLLVHAGIHPQWSVAEVLIRAESLSHRLRSGDWSWYRNITDPDGYTAAILTRLRGFNADLSLADQWTGHPSSWPPSVTPWFQIENRLTREHASVSGHWAALGLVRHEKHISIDAGCVYGGDLVAFSLAGGRTHRIACLPEDRIDQD